MAKQKSKCHHCGELVHIVKDWMTKIDGSRLKFGFCEKCHTWGNYQDSELLSNSISTLELGSIKIIRR